MSDLATFAAERDDDVVVGRLVGEIDLSNAEQLERSIVDAVPNTVLGMVLDLSKLSYIDSSGIRLLLSLAGSLKWRGQDLVLAAPDGAQCRRVLTLAGVGGSVRLEATADAALARLR
ncbi:MAG: STAS domain-containing protein, partial [Actinomycetota bacterium]